MKSYAKLASALMLGGLGLITLERMGLAQLAQSNIRMAEGSTLIVSLMVIGPLILVAAGFVVFVGGKILGLK